MIENAFIILNDQKYKTRLHEHGTQPPDWLESGYMEGSKETLEELKNKQDSELKIYHNGTYTTLHGVVFGPVCQMYDDHYILHLDWKHDE